MIEFRGLLVDVDAGLVFGRRGHALGHVDTLGYVRIDRRSIDGGRAMRAHQVVWIAANGPIPDGLEINHRNGIKTDNRLANLELVTRSENIRHAFRSGLATNAGDANPNRKLSAALVEQIRARRASGERIVALAREHGVNRNTISRALSGRTWKEAA